METVETTQVVFSLIQFLTIISFVIIQTATVVAVYWKLNKKVDDVDKKVMLNQSLNNNQYISIETAIDHQEKILHEKYDSVVRESDIKFANFDNTLKLTNKTLNELSHTVKEFSKLVIDVREEFGEHKAYSIGKENALKK